MRVSTCFAESHGRFITYKTLLRILEMLRSTFLDLRDLRVLAFPSSAFEMVPMRAIYVNVLLTER